MYDSIHLVIKESDLDSPLSFLEEIPCKIDLDKRKCTQYSVFGHIEKMSVMVNGATLSILGSLSTWNRGNNIYGIEFKDIKNAIDSLGKCLGVPLDKAIVKRIDVGQSFKMDFLPHLYYPSLYHLNKFGRSDLKVTSLYFGKKSKKEDGGNLALVFYDKNAQLRKKGDSYPLVQKSLNLLRYEFRIKDTKTYFKRDIRCFELFSADFYRYMIHLWYSMYCDIDKRLEILEELYNPKFNGVNELNDSCVALCIHAFDIEKAIEIASEKGMITPQNKHNVLKRVKKIKEGLVNLNLGPSLIDELSEKIEAEYKRQLEELEKYNDSLPS